MLDSPLAPPWLVITSPQYFKDCGLKYTTPPAKYIAPSAKARRCVVKPFKPVINEKYKYYTSEEDAIIRKYYQAIGSRGCIEKLDGRSIQSVVKRARLLKINYGRPGRPHLKALESF